MGKRRFSKLLLVCVVVLMAGLSAVTRAQEDETAREDVSVVTRDLTDRDPLVRQRAAEELARLAVTGQRRLLEGYRLQETNKRVGLALDWALYRAGKESALYALVEALDSPKLYLQAQGYLSEIDSPEPLYKFLADAQLNTLIRLLEVLARAGDDSTLEVIKPYESSLNPKIADAARFVKREIMLRRAQLPPANNTRPRQTGQVQSSTP